MPDLILKSCPDCGGSGDCLVCDGSGRRLQEDIPVRAEADQETVAQKAPKKK